MRIVLIFIFTAITSLGLAQVGGTVLDENGKPLAFANIYLENSTIGTSSNDLGEFILRLRPGNYVLFVQYVGYKTEKINIQLQDEPIEVQVQLFPEAYSLESVTISSNAEDPAYAIIRKAQAKRKYHKNLINEYACDVFIKGNQKVLDAPEKILGQEIGDLEGVLDTNRQGIVYLSESISKLYVRDGQIKEVLESSKFSGQDQGYSFNSAIEMDQTLYDNTTDIFRSIVSPIASNALSFYKYKLLGAKLDDAGYLINQIEVRPKNDNLPAYSGELYIVEDLWNIHSFDLILTDQNIGLPFIDTIQFQQIYIPTKTNDFWVKASNIISFRAGTLGFDFSGKFAAVYSQYDFSPIDPKIFNDEIYYVDPKSNKKTEAYWDSIRPIPLTVEEKLDYVYKDSLQIVKESPAYLDSIDRVANRFALINLLLGYNYQNSQKNSGSAFSSPLGKLSFSTVQGLNSSIGFQFHKAANKFNDRRFQVSADFDYGLAEKKLRPVLSLAYNHDRIRFLRTSFKIGERLSQYNATNPISKRQDAYETLVNRRNFLKAYNERFAEFEINRLIGPKLFGTLAIKLAERSSAPNTSDFSFFRRGENAFTPNIPILENQLVDVPFDDRALLVDFGFNLNLGRKIYKYPDRIFIDNADHVPTIRFDLQTGLGFFNANTNFAKLKLSAFDELNLGARGVFSYHLGLGGFLWQDEGLNFIDFHHFDGNQIFDVTSRGLDRFLRLPYFEYSTSGSFYQMNLQYDFNGLIMDRIPLINKLSWQLLLGTRILGLDNGLNYQEFSIGFDNVGYKLFRLFQVHLVYARQNPDRLSFVLSVKDQF